MHQFVTKAKQNYTSSYPLPGKYTNIFNLWAFFKAHLKPWNIEFMGKKRR